VSTANKLNGHKDIKVIEITANNSKSSPPLCYLHWVRSSSV